MRFSPSRVRVRDRYARANESESEQKHASGRVNAKRHFFRETSRVSNDTDIARRFARPGTRRRDDDDDDDDDDDSKDDLKDGNEFKKI